MIEILQGFREELALANDEFAKSPQGYETFIVNFWDHWIQSHFARMIAQSEDFVQTNLDALGVFWLSQPNDVIKAGVLTNVAMLRSRLNDVKINRLSDLGS